MALISYSSTVAALSKATKLITKSPHESVGIPTKEANGLGVKASKFIVNMLKDQVMTDSECLEAEMKQIRKEVDCLMDVILKAGSRITSYNVCYTKLLRFTNLLNYIVSISQVVMKTQAISRLDLK